MEQLFNDFNSTSFKGIVVYLPMISSDTLSAAGTIECKIKDSRVKSFWDPEKETGRLFAKVLGIKVETAWDVYLLYTPGMRWDEELPPTPAFWMHQLTGEDKEHYLDNNTLTQEVRRLLEEKPAL